MASFQEIARKKVAGVPVIYLAGGFVIILGIVAYKMKSTVPATGDEGTTTDNVPEDGATEATDMAGDYSGLKTSGTVIVSPQQTTKEDAVKPTNEDWERSAVTYLVESKKATAGDAQSAMAKYLDGSDLSFSEGQMRDAAIVKLGPPPEKLTTLGSTGSAPAQKQFTNFPGVHTVKGSNDNTAARIANLYWGTTGKTLEADALTIASVNPNLGPWLTVYSVGTKVNVPARPAMHYFKTTNSVRWLSQIAAKNGLSKAQVIALNPWLPDPVDVGVTVRVK